MLDGRNRLMAAVVIALASVAAGAPAPAAAPAPAPKPQPKPAAKPAPPQPGPGDEALRAYFRAEVARIEGDNLADVRTKADWQARRPERRRQLAEMLGLFPEPERTDLKVTVTGRIDHPEFTVENLHFQSRPGLYVTGNLYVPRNLEKPAPAVLYVCGHGNVKKDGVSYGAKVSYQHWPAWFARNGYVCLIIDTLQLGEIEGLHHGTYREKMWWWHSRGYTPAGVEAWNSVRALDYLCSRPEVDRERLGVTGRSGGGAYSWWLTALDERIKVAIPTAGITDLRNHVVDGCVEGHCDCMFMVNTYRWDYSSVAALASPRALLLSNSDKDSIFPLDGVYRTHSQVKRIYALEGADAKNLGLLITEGPHKDTQDLQVPAFRWFNKQFRQDDSPVAMLATKLFEPEQLRVFKAGLPADQVNTKIQETFVPTAPPPPVPEDAAAWSKLREGWMASLREKSFRGWPNETPAGAGASEARQAGAATAGGVDLSRFELASQADVRLPLWLAAPAGGGAAERVVLTVLDEQGWTDLASAARDGTIARFDPVRREAAAGGKWAVAFLAPRGIGPTAYVAGKTPADEKRLTHLRRRYYLLGQTWEGMQVWDVRRALQALRSMPACSRAAVALRAEGPLAGVALYASLFESPVARLELPALPPSHMAGPHFLNVLKFMDTPAAVAMAAERCDVVLGAGAGGSGGGGGDRPVAGADAWAYPAAVARKLGWPATRVQVAAPPVPAGQ